MWSRLRQRRVRVKKKNKRTFCFKNQYAFSWHIKINGWCEREYRYRQLPPAPPRPTRVQKFKWKVQKHVGKVLD